MDLDSRLQQLEERLMYAEQTIDTLDQEVLNQRRLLTQQQRQIDRLSDLIQQVRSGADKTDANEPPPPHY